MPSFVVETAQHTCPIVVERGSLAKAGEFLPEGRGKVFVVTTADVWRLHGATLKRSLGDAEILFLPAGETHKRLAELEQLAERMVEAGGDRASVVVAFGGGIVTDVGGFLAAVFMRGIPVIQAPTTLLAQVDAAIGGKTGVNLRAGKNLIGSFHQPLRVVIDPAVLDTLPEREYRAGLFEVVKHGIIADAKLFHLMRDRPAAVLAHQPDVVDRMITDSVRIKSEVVSGDERESGRRMILNLGHTFGHALEAETDYARFLHGEAVGWGLRAAARLAVLEGILSREDEATIAECVAGYGPLPSLDGVAAEKLAARLRHDKKTTRGKTFFVLPERVGQVRITADVDPARVLAAIEETLHC